jgi:hypothetical protein
MALSALERATMAREVRITRSLLRERNLLAARGVFTPLFDDYLAHTRRWVGEPDGLVWVMMRQGLAAAALYLTCRPTDEQTAWTFNFPEPPLNIFVSADAGRGEVAGRFFDADVRATDRNRLFVQTVRRAREPYLSVIEVRGFDLLAILERYYAQSEQATARFFEHDGDEFSMLMALPGVDEPWLRGLTREEGAALLRGPDARTLEERPVVFGCTCGATRILEIMAGMFGDRAEELFHGDPSVEVRCPRCGKAYRIARPAFDETVARRPPDPD